MKLLDRKNQIKNILLDNIAINKEFEKIQNEFLNWYQFLMFDLHNLGVYD